MTAASYDLATLTVLWRRDMMRFWREPSRVVSAIGQPVLFWLVLGLGLATTFRIPGLEVDYLAFFFPGVLMMVTLFAAVFATVSVIEDRHQGFLQAVLAGPGSRAALVLGKCLGSASVALVQVVAFLLLAPLAGYGIADIAWLYLLAILCLSAVGLSAMGFAVAWWLNSMPAYHAVLMTLLFPLWLASGAMFPPHGTDTVFGWLMRLNPVTYAVTGVRHGLYGGGAPSSIVGAATAGQAAAVVGIFALVSLWVAIIVCHRR